MSFIEVNGTSLRGGKFDRTRPPAPAEPVARAIAGARYTVADSGHYMAAQTPELLAKTIAEFLDMADRTALI